MQIELKLNKDFERTLNALRIKYGNDFEILNGVDESQLDYSEFLKNFIVAENLADASIDPNANSSHRDIRSFMTEKGKSSDKLFGLNKVFIEIKKFFGLKVAKDWLEQEFSKGFYLNDSTSCSLFAYCWAQDLSRLAREGLFFLGNNYNNKPAKHLTTFLDDCIEFISFLSNRQSGAVGLPNILIWAYWFWKKDIETGFYIKDPEYYRDQCFQKLIFRLNQPFLRIDQSAFTNMSIFDRKYLEALFGGLEYPDGTFAIDNIEEIMQFQKDFMKVVSDIRSEQMFTFPVLTMSFLYKDGRFQDEEFARWASKHNMKWADSNLFISDQVTSLSNCCRLLSDTSKLTAFQNSVGGSALSIGSCRVSTINLVRIAYETKCNKKKYLDKLRERTTLDCQALYAMRHILKRNIEKGLLPNYQEGAVELDKQYCTIGILGMYEVMCEFGFIQTDELGYKSYTEEGIEFAKDIFNVLNDVKDNFTDEFTFNIEQIPAENAAGVLAKADNLLYGKNKYFIYSNQWIPLYEKCTIEEKCAVSSVLDNLCSGGAIAHINIENRFPTEEAAWEMLNYLAEHKVIYSAFTTTINVCEDGHSFIGTTKCPMCGKGIKDKYRRVVGFYTPVSSWQTVRRREGDMRKWYSVLEHDMVM